MIPELIEQAAFWASMGLAPTTVPEIRHIFPGQIEREVIGSADLGQTGLTESIEVEAVAE